MENVAVIVTILAVDTEVFYSLGTVLHEKFHVDVSKHSMNDGVFVKPLHCRVFSSGHCVFFRWFLIENVPEEITDVNTQSQM